MIVVYFIFFHTNEHIIMAVRLFNRQMPLK